MDLKERRIILEQAKLLLEQSKRLQNKAYKTYDSEGDVSYFLITKQIDKLIHKFNAIVPKINNLFEDEGIDMKVEETKLIECKFEDVKDRTFSNTETPLLNIIFESTTIITFLDVASEFSVENIDTLSSLSKELNSIKKKIDSVLFQNLNEAQDEFEKGAFLGSSLICGKVVRACLDSIPGIDINEKINSLRAADLVREKDGRDFLLKANHFSRNLTSHDIKIFPTSSESVSYLGDAVKIVKVISEFKSKKLDHEG